MKISISLKNLIILKLISEESNPQKRYENSIIVK